MKEDIKHLDDNQKCECKHSLVDIKNDAEEIKNKINEINQKLDYMKDSFTKLEKK